MAVISIPISTTVSAPDSFTFKPKSNYIPCLDGLRAFSIILVLLAHFKLLPQGIGGVGVTIFFFISGYLITHLLIKEHESSNDISVKAFYMRRLFRIVPASFICIIVIALIYTLFQIPYSSVEIWPALLYVENYYKAYSHLNPGPDLVLPIGVLWSLAVEEHFYLAYPVLLKRLFHSKKVFLGLVIGTIVAVNIWRIILAPHFKDGMQYIYYATDTRIDSILYGCLLSIVAVTNKGRQLIQSLSKAPLFYIATALFFAICFVEK